MSSRAPVGGDAAVRASLAQALTFHASFDRGADADFALGDPTLYSAMADGGRAPGLGEPPLTIVQDGGKYGAALEFGLENSHVVLYKAELNVAYSPSDFRGTISFWMSLDPAEIPSRYCDPIQVTDKKYSDACIWIDFTKNDTPPDLRLGIFGDLSGWDVNQREGSGEEFFWRLVKVAEPPFAKGAWTHVAITWDGVNSSQNGRGRLYFNGEYQGATGRIAEPFTWDAANAWIRLGTGHFVGRFDDIAAFNRPLAPEEIRVLYGLERGIVELRAP
jgi:hypothetical protein